MIRLRFIVCGLLLLAAASVSAQETYFGKNKVQYRDFDWNYIQSRHFDVHFYGESYPVAKFTADVLESSYVEISDELQYRIQKRIPVFLYNSHNDFQQTNIINELLPEGVGGFTEAFKNRIVIPFTGSYEDLRHVLHHELTHAVVYDILFGGALSSILSRQRLFDLPLWFAEGYAEYSSRHGWDYFSDMVVRDATINGYLAPPLYLGGYLAYKQGQAMVKFIADKYGEDKLGELLRKGKVHLTMGKALKATLNISEEEFWEEFSKEMKRRYWPEIALRKEANEIGKRLTKSREDGSFYNEKPVWAPQGEKLAIFTDKHDYTEIVLISAIDGKIIDRLTSAERSADLESLHSYVSGMSFSPDGKRLTFVAKSKGKEAIFLLDVKRKKIVTRKRLDFNNIISPSWSPDGKAIAFTALKGVSRDLYLWYLDDDRIVQMTDDRFDDIDPSWMPDSRGIVFASDRPHPDSPALQQQDRPYVNHPGAARPGDFGYGDVNLFQIDLATLAVEPLRVGPGANKNPSVSPDGKRVAFLSNRNGIDNIYVADLANQTNFAATDILTGIMELNWSPDGTKIAFSAFYKGGFDVFVLKEIVPVGTGGELALTGFASGKYNLLNQSMAKADTLATPDSSAVQPSLSDSTMLAADTEAARLSDSLRAPADSLARTTDTVQTARADSSASDSTSRGRVEGDEYVFTKGGKESDALDTLLTRLPSEESPAHAAPMTEPASFDSIPDRLPSGEFAVNKYKVRFTPDYVGGGFGYDTFFGLRGQSYFVFSDYLGNHQIYLAADLSNNLDQSYVQGFYFNNTRRINWGIGLFHTKNFYVDSSEFLFSDRFYGVTLTANRPSSIFSRYEVSLGQYFIDRKFYDRELGDDRPNRNSKITAASASWVFDNVLWGYTGPINGRRAKLTLEAGVDLFDRNKIDFYALEFDWRKYWNFKQNFSMAFRVAGGGSEGNTPKQYFLGGTTNWIGQRDNLQAKVYDEENLYFRSVVTPLRGVPYYELSGDRFALVNWEFRFPLIQYLAMRFPLPLVLGNISGSIFTDIGATWFGNDFKFGTSQDGGPRTQDVQTGFGVGARMNLLGFALLRYDLAWSTDYRTVSKKPTSYFSFGADF